MKYLTVTLALLLAVACSAPSQEVKDEGGMAPIPITQGNAGTESSVDKGDVNNDGQPDVWNFYKEVPNPDDPEVPKRLLIRKEADLNFDGKKDITREFSDDGVLQRETADLDYDGAVDQENVYVEGVLAEKRLFRSGDGRVFIWKFFKDGKMTRLDRDEDQDGRPDYCELWYAGEKLSKRGWDKTGDGECDYWENAD